MLAHAFKLFARVFSQKGMGDDDIQALLREHDAALGRCMTLLDMEKNKARILGDALAKSAESSRTQQPPVDSINGMAFALAVGVLFMFMIITLNERWRRRGELERDIEKLRTELYEKKMILEGPDGLIQKSIEWAMLPVELPMPPLKVFADRA